MYNICIYIYGYTHICIHAFCACNTYLTFLTSPHAPRSARLRFARPDEIRPDQHKATVRIKIQAMNSGTPQYLIFSIRTVLQFMMISFFNSLVLDELGVSSFCD